MGKRKSRRNKSKTSGQKKTKSVATLLIFAVAISGALGAVFYATKSDNAPSANPAPARGQLLEIRPVLSPALFTGKAALAYKYAAEIPKVIDSQFCYCYCKKEHGHKTLLTCFTNMHGSKCDICMDEVIYAYNLYKEGKSMDEIVVAVDKKFYRPYRSSRF